MSDAEEFKQITGADDELANYFMEAAKGDLQEALSAYYERQQSRITSVHDNRPEELYAGGKNSGIAVQGRPDPSDDVVKRILEKAAKEGQEPSSFEQTQSRFVGTGYRLGSDQVPSSTIPGEEPDPSQQPVTRLLTFWKDGFSVEDGELYRYDDPRNQELLKQIQNGRAPIALLNVLPNQPVEVKVAHRAEENYQPPPKKLKPFQGTGNRLGGITSSTSMPGSFPTQTTQAPPPTPQVKLDESQPITSLQIRLGDGTRLVAKFNHSHTIRDVRQFVQSYISLTRARPEQRAFVLQTMMPVKVLSDDNVTLADAKLLNSVVVQRFT